MQDIQKNKVMDSHKETAVENEQKGNRIQLIVFRQGDEEYAIRIDQIKEIVITPSITKMPQTAEYIRGVANIRGNIIAIIDLEKKFGLTSSKEEHEANKNYTLVLESSEYKAGIQVRQVPSTLSVYESDIEETVNIVGNSSLERNYIKGIVKKAKRLIILIDTYKVISEQELQTVNQVTA